jgi:tetratricopeptide (TPR) repeat protein
MNMRLSLLPALLLVTLSTGCSSSGTVADRANPEQFHQDNKVRVMVDQAERSIRRGDLESTKAYLALMAKSLEKNPQSQLLLARTLIAEGRWTDCAKVLSGLAQDWPENPEVDLVQGTLDEARGRWQAARVAYSKAAEKDPDSIEAILLMVRTFHADGDPASAAAMLEREYLYHRGDFELQIALAESYLAAGEPEMAAAWYEEALSHDQRDRAVRARLAFAQSLAGKHVEALKTVRTVADKDLLPHEKLAMSRSALLVDEPRQASTWLLQYLDRYPDDDGAWLDLARAYYMMDRHPKSMEALASCLRLNPGRAHALVLLGHLRLRAGQDSLAINSYLEAIRLGAEASQLAQLMEQLVNRSSEPSNPATSGVER